MAVEAQVTALRASFKAEQEEFARTAAAGKLREEIEAANRLAMGRSRRILNKMGATRNNVHLTEDR
jgi:hypothetical protein